MEAEIVDKTGKTITFRKTANNHTVNFLVDGVDVIESQYEELLKQTELIQQVSNTLIIDSASVDKVAMMSDKKRSQFIEFFSTNRDLIESYKNLTKIHSTVQTELSANIKQHKEIAAEKKKMSKKIGDEEKRTELMDKLEHESHQFKLFRQYHNEKLLDKVDEDIESKRRELSELKLQNNASLEQLTELKMRHRNAEIQDEVSKDQLEKFCDEKQDSHISYLTNLERLQTYNLQREAADILQNQANNDKKSIKRGQKTCQELEKVLNNKNNLENETRNLIQLRVEHEMNNLEDLDSFIYSNEFINVLKGNVQICEKNLSPDTEIEELQQKIETFRTKKTETVQEIEDTISQIQEYEDSDEKLANLTKAIENFLQKSRIHRDIIDELKKMFPGRVHGRMEDFVESEDESIRKLLGSFGRAIIIDSRQTAKKCLDLLTLRQIQPTHEIFLILAETGKSKSLKDLVNGQSIASFGNAFITNFINSTSDELQEALMFCVKPSLVADSLEAVDILLSLEELKKLNFADKSSSCVFTKQGFIKVMSCDVEIDDVNEENLAEKIEEEASLRLDMLRDKRIRETENLRLIDLRLELDDIEKSLFTLENMLRVKQKIKSEFNYFTEKVDMVLNGDEQIKTNFEKFETLQNDFNEQNGALVESCKEFSVAELKLQKVKKQMQLRQNEMMENSRMAIELNVSEEEFENLHAQVTTEKDELDKVSSEFNEKLESYGRQHEQVTNLYKQIGNLTLETSNNENQIFHAYDDLLKYEHLKSSAMSENYLIVRETFNNWKMVDLSRGSIKNILTLPNRIPPNFNLVENQMQNVQFNSTKLKNALKNENINVEKRTIEFEDTLKNLQIEFEKQSKRINLDVNEDRLRQKQDDLAEMVRKVEIQKKRMQTIQSQLDAMIVERRTKYLECIATINEGIAEFCDHLFDGAMKGKLEPEESDEPYLCDLTFQWPTLDNPENIVTELDFNNLAAFAMLWGILKYKKQKFLILNDGTMKICENIDNFFKHQRQLQVVSFTSKLADDNSKFIVKSIAGTFVVKEL